VDETDIGKIQAGLRATVTVDAYPNRPFEGVVLKIEPLAVTQQNVTMFPVMVRIQNRQGLLKPGMNAEVEIHVGRRDGVLAVPNAALRTQRDVASAAEVLGLSAADVQAQLARATAPSADSGRPAVRPAATQEKAAASTMTLQNGQTIALPEGVTEQQVRAAMRKRFSGEATTPAEQALLRRVFQGMGAGGGGARRTETDSRFGGRYIVFVQREGKPVAVNIATGLTDLDYSEVVTGLTEQDSVLILPSASLIASQKEFTERMQRMTGGTGIPGMSSQSSTGSKATSGATTTRP
jgi:HlyD family secretion protein